MKLAGIAAIALICVVSAAVLLVLPRLMERENEKSAVADEMPEAVELPSASPAANSPDSLNVPAEREAETEDEIEAAQTAARPETENDEGGDASQENGEVAEHVPLPLEGYKICVDPGHQQRGDNTLESVAPGSSEKKARVSSGTGGVATGIPEHELTLSVALKLRDALEEQGAIVVMTRDKADINISNQERAALANDIGCDAALRIHADGSENRSINGYSILIPGEAITPDIAEESRRIAEVLDETMQEYVNTKPNGIVVRNDLTGFNWSEVPVVLLEMGFMSNPDEDRLMQTDAFQTSVAEALTEAMIRYFESNL